MPKELNFLLEGKNADKLRELIKDEKHVVIPKIFWEYSNEKVLVMSFEGGSSITDLDYLRKNDINFKKVATILSKLFYKQIFQFGFVHSDPHPGNIFVRKEFLNGKEITKVILLDHGLYRDYDESFRYNYCNLWRCKIFFIKQFLHKIRNY